MYHYTPAKVTRYLEEIAREFPNYDPSKAYVKMNRFVMKNAFEDLDKAFGELADLSNKLADHSCKSKFIPGVIVGAGLTVGLGIVMSKRDARKKNTP